MSITKITYVNGVTVIGADNLNAIQDAIIDLEENSSVPTNVRQAILALFEAGAYAQTGLTDEIAIVESWAEEVTSLTISPTTLSLSNNTPQTITATVVPSGSTVSWSSSDTSVATVVAGVVTGVGNGECVITASAGDISKTCAVTVTGFVELVSISAVYTQSGTVYTTDSLDSLKADLVVTATYSDTSSETIPSADYTLSGTLTEGTSTIYVVYGGKTTTFTVTVSQRVIRVFKGKGTSGTTIVDNANRALSEMIYVGDAESIVTQWNYSNTQDAIKFAVNSSNFESDTPILADLSYIGAASIPNVNAWRTSTDELATMSKVNNVYRYVVPASGYIRLLFRNVADASTAIGTISGTYYINGVPHTLVEKDASEFE